MIPSLALTFFLAVLAGVQAHFEPINAGGMQQVIEDDSAHTTTTIAITRHVTLTTTTTMGYSSTPTEVVPPLVATWFDEHDGKADKCDRTACAEYDVWFKCSSGGSDCIAESEWIPVCDCEDTPDDIIDESMFEDEEYRADWETCSLGPGREVPCDLETDLPIFHFGKAHKDDVHRPVVQHASKGEGQRQRYRPVPV